jgi:hypothetical protein
MALSNELPLAIEKITATDGKTMNVEFNETSCAIDCSIAIKIESYSSDINSTSPITIGLSILTNSAVVWGFPFWWTRIGTTQKTITTTLDVQNSTVRLLA